MYFRVTGTPFNAVERPTRSSDTGRGGGWDDFDFDPDLGGEVVAGRRKGLSLISSRIDGTAFGKESLAYAEWTLVFETSIGENVKPVHRSCCPRAVWCHA